MRAKLIEPHVLQEIKKHAYCTGCDHKLMDEIKPPHLACCPDGNYVVPYFLIKKLIAVPIASESQDDLWEEIIDILLSNGYDRDRASNSECVMAEREIKSKFTIQRRKE